MEPAHSLKRPLSVAINKCLICQEDKPGYKLRSSSDIGVSTLKEAALRRRHLRDLKNYDVIDGIEHVLDQVDQKPVWHNTCYSTFANKSKILKLQKTSLKTVKDEPGTSAKCDTPTLTRSKSDPIDWTMCMFCQKVQPKLRLSSVMTQKMSRQILDNAQFDHNVSVRVADVNDLIASEAKYHFCCLSAFKRQVTRASTDNDEGTDIAMVWLTNELRYSAGKGHVFQLSNVWDRYVELATESDTIIPQAYYSRRTTFKEKLQLEVGDNYYFVPVLDRIPSERDTLMISLKSGHTAMLNVGCSEDEQLTIPQYAPDHSDTFLSMVHVSLQLRSDIMAMQGNSKLSVSEADAIDCVPNNLYMFLRIMYGGDAVFESEGDELPEDNIQQKVLSVAQDIVYGISGGKKLTPKYIGLASTIHQATRSKGLVQLLHKAGHCLSYEQTLKMDSALAQHTLQTLDPVTGAVIPPNIVANKFVHYTADNIDILDETLDGKNTFHATQVAAWQRGQTSDSSLHTCSLEASSSQTLDVPSVIEELLPVNIKPNKPLPVFESHVGVDLFDGDVANCESVKNAKAADLAFFVQRQTSDDKEGWTVFNETLSSEDPEITAVGYIPIIIAPAHEFDTLNTVVKRCMAISSSLGQEHTVITVDQALYCKLMELKWSVPEYQKLLIPRLGGLHISMNFLKTIGDHMNCSGLAEVWTESGILGQGTAELVLSGKAYNKGMRVHKLTMQALWRLMMPHVLDHIEDCDVELSEQISAMRSDPDPEDNAELSALLKQERFRKPFDEFVASKSSEHATISFWLQYLEMVEILLMFIRAQRDGIWDLHLKSFSMMLPYFMRYDHNNYARWGPVYLAEMHQLPAPILAEFEKGNFVVKRSHRKFNQVDPDQAQEWLNGVGKKGGGIVGITKTPSALCRWTLSYNLRSHIALETYAMYQMRSGEKILHNESRKARKKRDNVDEDALCSTFQRFGVFSPVSQSSRLQNIATKDLATEAIEESLLSSKDLGVRQLQEFVQERLVTSDSKDKPNASLHAPLTRNNAPTFAALYSVKDTRSKDLKQVMKADRNVLQRLITAFEAGRSVDMPSILQHELMPVPVSIAELNGTLRTGNKSILADLLTENIDCPETIQVDDQSSCLIIDGQAVVVAIGKPATAANFGDLADIFVNSVLKAGSQYKRIDIAFDRYREQSIKSSTRSRRTKSARPIRRVVEGRDVPLPKNWENFMALPENKADLARFLSEQVLAHAPPDKEIVVAGGFVHELEVRSSNEASDVTMLRATHEEADTRLVLHAVHSQYNTVVVSARDTDVLLLLIAHFPRMQCIRLFMMAGTSKKRRYIPIDQVFNTLSPTATVNLLPFHALTGSDTTSYISGHTKRSAWKVFNGNHQLLTELGTGDISPSIYRSVETFMCRLYNVTQTDSIDKARYHLFSKSLKPEALPPTSDALHFHIMRVHHQTMIWRQADCAIPEIPVPESMGWTLSGDSLVPMLMSLSPIPAACLETIYCSCHMQCRTMRCKCRKSGLRCTALCRCKTHGDDTNPCMNIV